MSESLRVCGGQALHGCVQATGSSSAGLLLLAAAAAAHDTVTLVGVPGTRACQEQLHTLQRLGSTVEVTPGYTRICNSHSGADIDLRSQPMRHALLFLGPLLTVHPHICLPLPCNAPTGPQPIDLYMKALHALGAIACVDKGSIRVERRQMHGCDICLDVPSFGATWTTVTAATAATGRTRVIGATKAPELVDAVSLLNRMGARIVGAGTDTITIYGPTSLSGGAHEVMPDRLISAFLLIAGVATGGGVEVRGVIPEHLRAVTAKLTEAGARLTNTEDSIKVNGSTTLQGVSVRSGFYPGFPSQLQPAMCALLLRANDTSIVTETVYRDRMFHIEELQRMQAHIMRDGQTAIIRGRQMPGPACVRALDAGSAACLLLAALMAHGESLVERADALLDWFGDPVQPLLALGGGLSWVNPAKAAV